MAKNNWTIDELAHAGAEHRDPTYIAGYDRKAGTEPGEDVARLRELGMDGGSALVDLGAGTGSFALAAAPFCGRVVAVDVSLAMLDALRKKAEATGATNVEVVRAGFLSYEYTSAPADFVYSRNALHHLPDFWKALALRRIAEMLRPGGVLLLRDLVFSFEPSQAQARLKSWFADAAPMPDVGWTRAEYEEHVRTEYSTFSWLLEPMLEHAGFAIRTAEHSPSGIYAAYVCVRKDAL